MRKKYIKPYSWKKPSAFKLVQLLSVCNIKDLNNLGKFLYFAEKVRKHESLQQSHILSCLSMFKYRPVSIFNNNNVLHFYKKFVHVLSSAEYTYHGKLRG
jgi:hypothetical protein